jgi:hypothetical protein
MCEPKENLEAQLPPIYVPPDSAHSWGKLHELYDIYRDYMKHEDDLINQRTTWHNVLQGFLFATLAVVEKWQASTGFDPIATQRLYVVVIVAAAGILIAYFAWKSIHAAHLAINNLRERWPKMGGPFPDFPYLPNLAGGGSEKAVRDGKGPAIWIPIVIIGAWAGVLTLCAIDLHRIHLHNLASDNPPPITTQVPNNQTPPPIPK